MSSGIPYEQIPSSWYVIAKSTDIRKREVKKLRYFGRDLVLYRTEDGTAHLASAICPHMGAHLSGGWTKNNTLVCPMHAFAFDGGGQCVATPYPKNRPPTKARLRVYPVDEQAGLIMAYHDADGREPEWRIPKLDMQDWRPFAFHEWTFRGHPQETSENSVDVGHFGTVHHYAKAEIVRPLDIEGPTLRSGYAVIRNLDWVGLPWLAAELRFEADVHGLGFSLVKAGVKAVGVHARLLVLPTPIEADKLHLRIACTVKELPVPGLTAIIHAIALRAYAHDVAQDVIIWQSKDYVDRPLLAEGDGPIAKYRQWCQQFYSAMPAALG